MSFNVTPINLNIASILDTIVSSIDIAKNGNGEMFWPFYGVNLIGDVATGEGYSIKLSNPETLYVEGMIVVPELTPIQIPAGNSILGYLRQDAAPVSVMLSPIVSSIQIVKNELGLMYWPYFGINLLGNMEPGEGYNIKLQNSETLIYPANSMNFAKSTIINESTEHFIIDANTGSNMTLGIPEEAWITKPDHGDEIGLFNKNNELVGSGLYRGDHMAISLWGDDETTNEIEYLGLSESFQMVLWKAADNSLTQLSVSEWKQGSNQFSDKAIAVVGKFARTTDAVLSSQLMQNYPNPFIYNSDISIELNSSSEIELNLYNSLGEKLFEIAHGSYSTGIHTFTVDGSKLATGHYYYKLSSSDGVITKKMQKI